MTDTYILSIFKYPLILHEFSLRDMKARKIPGNWYPLRRRLTIKIRKAGTKADKGDNSENALREQEFYKRANYCWKIVE